MVDPQAAVPACNQAPWKWFSVLPIVFAMFAIVALAASVVLYVAFPYRGVAVPRAPWLGEAMRRGVDRFPTLHPRDDWRERQRG